MKNHEFNAFKHPVPQICVWQIDGSARTFAQIEPDVVNELMAELHSGHLFTRDSITIADHDSVDSFCPPRITRIDLVTEQATVWDFPFIFGAPIEVAENEFFAHVQALSETRDARTGFQLLLDTETVSGQRTCLSMEIVAGFPAARIGQVFSLFNQRQLIFGLRTEGVGVLNLANVARFAIHPESIQGSADARDAKRTIPVYHPQQCARKVPVTAVTETSQRIVFGQE